MVVRTLLLFVLGGGLALSGIVSGVQAQDLDGTGQRPVLAQFEDAQSLAVDPRGRLYVADAGRDVVEILSPGGERLDVIGGSGTRVGEFDLPSDVDPTNGQLLLVADTYNGRIQRFSEEGQYLESLPIGRTDRVGGEGWGFEHRGEGDPIRGDGRPISVVRDDDESIFVLGARKRQILEWTDLGGLEPIVDGGVRLQDPVALAIGNSRQVYVADAGQEAVLVYDSFGTFRRRVPTPPLPNVQALAVHRGRLHIVSPDTVRIWDRAEGLVAEHSVDLSEPLVDVAPTDGEVYLLTASRLLRRARW
jgi:sugar lactone lactonase YvrE